MRKTAGLSSVTFVRYPVAEAKDVVKKQFRSMRFSTKAFGGGRGRSKGIVSRLRQWRHWRFGSKSKGKKNERLEFKKPSLRDAGSLLWRGHEADFVLVRKGRAKGGPTGGPPGEEGPGSRSATQEKAHKGPRFYDILRVNLSTPGQCLVGYVRFDMEFEGSKDAAEGVLQHFAPRGGAAGHRK